MNFMKKNEWARMSPEQKWEYLNEHELEVQSQSMMNPLAKSTDPDEEKVRNFYRAMCGGVVLTYWFRDEQQAMELGVKSLASTLQSLEMEKNQEVSWGIL